jgi:hypothetical protein
MSAHKQKMTIIWVSMSNSCSLVLGYPNVTDTHGFFYTFISR